MCGIVGYQGEDEASDIIFKGLKKLEYRGYDSAGIATAGNPSIKIDKGTGTVDEAVSTGLDGNSGVGHTRWATHGGINQTNAHPHTDCEDTVAVVHNGIIDNHRELREELEEHEFDSETDTEVIPHLLEEAVEEHGSVKDAAMEVIDKLEGSFAVVATFDTGEMVAFRRNSPLVLGVGDGETFVASDVTPFLEHTENAVFLEDGDMAVIDEEGHEVYRDGEKVEREVERVDWDAQQASKAGFDHFMEKEIKEQPTTVKRAVFQDRSELEKARDMIEDAENVYFTACGTAGIAASLGAKYFRDAGYRPEVELSHELEYRTGEIGENDLVIAVSQSGETADLLSVLRQTDAEVLAVVNVVGSTLARNADHRLFVNAGPEIGVASTKAFTGQVAVLKMLKYALEDRIDEGRESLLETAEKAGEVIEDNEDTIEELSSYFSDKDDIYFIGRNRGHDLAREAALKLKELSYIHAEAFPGGEFKHGTLALVEEGVPVVSFLKEEGYEDILTNTVEAKGRGADIIGVGTEEPPEGFEHFIEIPEDENSEILEIIPFQLLAYLTSVEVGNNPDKPRNLAKSITVK
ncbi:MAG: glutamine--fructose-6-phosphate transaminase (isomerizing) [Candidatus Nanohaloarchaea archaeon]